MIHRGAFKVPNLDLSQLEDVTCVAALLASPKVTAVIRYSVRQTGVAAGHETPRAAPLSSSSFGPAGRVGSQAERSWQSRGRSFVGPEHRHTSAVRTDGMLPGNRRFRVVPPP